MLTLAYGGQGPEDHSLRLRHTCASLAVSVGVNLPPLQRLLGHTSAQVTLDTYADLLDDDVDAVAITLITAICARVWPRAVCAEPRQIHNQQSSWAYARTALAVAEGFEPYSATWSGARNRPYQRNDITVINASYLLLPPKCAHGIL